MTHAAAPMPESLRHFMRAGHHPARGIACPWCHVAAHKPCQVPSNGKQPNQVHQQRMAAWAQLVACCTTCQVTPEVPCHEDGRAFEDGRVHAARYGEAAVSAA
jgi:hypothetical protein